MSKKNKIRISSTQDVECLIRRFSKTVSIDHLTMLAKIIDEEDTYTRGHCDKVMKYSLKICRRLKLSAKDREIIKTASLLHDIGKVGVDLTIISKRGKLTERDWQEIKRHPEIGANILSEAGFYEEIVAIIKYHHERFNGGGYPDPDKKAEEIPLGSRIIAVADAFDAMTSDRPYRKAMPRAVAIKELKRCSGSQFDPQIVEAFVR